MARDALAEQREEEVVGPLSDAAERARSDPRLWQWAGLLHRGLDDRTAALHALRRAASLAPADALIAHTLARTTLEAGLPATALFEAASRLAPQDGNVLLGLAAARVAEGDASGAEEELARLLHRHPGWLPGHHDLAHLRWTMGEGDRFDQSLREALTAAPKDAALWHALVMLLVRAEQHDTALRAISDARGQLGEQPFLLANEAVARSELGDVAGADAAFARLAGGHDATVAVRWVRHLLRTGRVQEAASAIEPLLAGEGAALAWPYAQIAWRLLADPRAEWLEGDPRLVGVYDLADAVPSLEHLATLLQSLHRAREQQFDQSVRGGTQTDGGLFQRIEPEIVALRRAVADAVQRHIAQLPAIDPRHPTLAPRRDRSPRFSGSWSVRLRAGGRHSNHVHPAGWLSSAFYVALPEAAMRADPRAGHLTLGAPQSELGLDLPPTRWIEPKPGRLVLFPSTMWHGTEPFADGQRLTVAFDIAPPPAR